MRLEIHQIKTRRDPNKPGRYLVPVTLDQIRAWLGHAPVTMYHNVMQEPNVVAGNHYHREKVEIMYVSTGRAMLYLVEITSSERFSVDLSGEGDVVNVVLVPAGYAHAVVSQATTPTTLCVWSTGEPRRADDDFAYQVYPTP